MSSSKRKAFEVMQQNYKNRNRIVAAISVLGLIGTLSFPALVTKKYADEVTLKKKNEKIDFSKLKKLIIDIYYYLCFLNIYIYIYPYIYIFIILKSEKRENR